MCCYVIVIFLFSRISLFTFAYVFTLYCNVTRTLLLSAVAATISYDNSVP